MRKKIYLIRHGESLQNSEDLLSGVTDVPLSSTGRKQCLKLRDFFKKYKVEKVFSSPLSRAVESASIIFPNNEILIEKKLIEFDYGEYEGIPRTYDDYIMRQWNTNPGEITFPGGKSIKSHAKEVFDGLLSIAQSNKVNSIVCVSHRTTIRLIVAQILQLDFNYFRKIPCSNCGITLINYNEKQGFQLESINMEQNYLFSEERKYGD